uniref:Uncharacterized protein n=1 Tax=Theileria annulata TaxID=5874 RepID=A0A3B0NAT8_THEAN
MCLFRFLGSDFKLLNLVVNYNKFYSPSLTFPLNFSKIVNYNGLGKRFTSSLSENSDSTSVSDIYFKTPTSERVFSDILTMDSLSPREFRIFLNDVVKLKVDDVLLWSKAATYCIENASKFKFFDALSVLESFTEAKIYDKALFTEFSRYLTIQSPMMEPRHLIQCINVYAFSGTFPQALFLEVFYGIIKQSEKMYAAEFVDMFNCLSRWNIKNKQVLSALCKTLAKNVSILRYAELTQVAACCRNLEIEDETFRFILDSWQKKELAMMTIQEMLDCLKKLKNIEVKWAYYEELLFKEFVKQINELDGDDIAQLADPFDCLEFLKSTGALSKEFLLSLTKWCADAVHNPPTRSQKRPLSHQLVELYNLVQEYGIEEKYIDKAVLKFVTSKGGLRLRNPKPIPTVYKPNRKYVFTDDPENPRPIPEIKYLENDTPKESEKSKHINKIVEELEPYPKFFDKINIKKPSTQSCGKASFRLKPKTYRHKNIPVKQ